MKKITGKIHDDADLPDGYLEIFDRVIKEKLEVEIVNTDENGEWVYAIVVCDSSWIGDGEAYWLKTYKRLHNAKNFCLKHNFNCRKKVQYPYEINSSRSMKIIERET